uniref:Uncharacterized protein n=1 Tax=Panagrolaimus davidi TaxID=227884 RepID=A0A914QSS1_9BILA
MKGLIILGICLIGANYVYCDHTVGEALDEGIADAKQDLKAAGQVVTAPFRFVGAKAKEAVDSVGEGVGDVLEGAGSSLQSAGKSIGGDISSEHAAVASKDKADNKKVVAVEKESDTEKAKVNTVKLAPLEVEKVEAVKAKPVSAEHVENVKVVKKDD